MTSPLAAVVFLPSVAFGANDAYLPLVAHLKTLHGDQITHDTVYLDEEAYSRMAMSRFHVDLFQRLGKVWHFYLGRRRLRLARVAYRLSALFAFLLFRRITHRRMVIIAPWMPITFSEKVIIRIASLFAPLLVFPGCQLPMTNAYADRFRPERWNIFYELGYKTANPTKRKHEKPKIAICYTEDEIPNYREIHGWNNTVFLPIGLPRLYPTWPSIVRSIGSPLLTDELLSLGFAKTEGPVICIILTNPDYFWFAHPDGFVGMLDDVVRTVLRVFPEIPVLLKTKSDMAHLFAAIADRYSNPYVKLTSCGLGAIASRCIVAISVQESSGLMEFATAGVPAIEYGIYNDTWLRITPHKSCLVGIPGIIMADTIGALESELTAAKAHNGPSDIPQQMRMALKHHDGAERIFSVSRIGDTQGS